MQTAENTQCLSPPLPFPQGGQHQRCLAGEGPDRCLLCTHPCAPIVSFPQVAANTKGIALVKELIGEYGLPVVQAYMRHIQVGTK